MLTDFMYEIVCSFIYNVFYLYKCIKILLIRVHKRFFRIGHNKMVIEKNILKNK